MPVKTLGGNDRLVQTASAANGAVAPSLAAPTTDGVFNYLTGIILELVNVAAPAAGTVAVTIAGLQNTLTFTLSRLATANIRSDGLILFFNRPLRSSAHKTAISASGNSGDANTTLRITLIGHQGGALS